MPELPDVELYITRLSERLVGQPLESLRVFNAFTLRSVCPSPKHLAGAVVQSVFRLGKRIVLEFEDERFCVIHLMIAGRFQWQEPLPPLKPGTGKIQLAAWRFPNGQLTLVESSTKKRAGIHLVGSRAELDAHTRSGLDLFSASSAEFIERLRAENRTLKRALTSPANFDGIGNAYSDEILFAARLSPVRLTKALSDEECERLFLAARETLGSWRERLPQIYRGFPRPSDITAFRPEFNVHGKFGKPCTVCGSPVQHIVYAENETNYCATCQNEGRLLADRSLSRLLKSDWPKTLEEMVGDR